MKKAFLSLTMILAFALVCLAADLTGNWKGTIQVPGGAEPLEITYKLKADGDKLTGVVSSTYGELPVSDGKITGTDFTFKLQIGDNSIDQKGKFYGDSIVIKSEFQGIPMQTTFKRVAEK